MFLRYPASVSATVTTMVPHRSTNSYGSGGAQCAHTVVMAGATSAVFTQCGLAWRILGSTAAAKRSAANLLNFSLNAKWFLHLHDSPQLKLHYPMWIASCLRLYVLVKPDQLCWDLLIPWSTLVDDDGWRWLTTTVLCCLLALTSHMDT